MTEVNADSVAGGVSKTDPMQLLHTRPTGKVSVSVRLETVFRW